MSHLGTRMVQYLVRFSPPYQKLDKTFQFQMEENAVPEALDDLPNRESSNDPSQQFPLVEDLIHAEGVNELPADQSLSMELSHLSKRKRHRRGRRKVNMEIKNEDVEEYVEPFEAVHRPFHRVVFDDDGNACEVVLRSDNANDYETVFKYWYTTLAWMDKEAINLMLTPPVDVNETNGCEESYDATSDVELNSRQVMNNDVKDSPTGECESPNEEKEAQIDNQKEDTVGIGIQDNGATGFTKEQT
uniref:Enhancer of polycomb-like protein n=1 Tax=Mesocestoides corti TaxID=53468 RepID=A0A5K3EMB8_MESCO